MLTYVGKRMVQAIPVLVGITLFSFFLIHLIPGDPGRIQLGPHASIKQVEELDRELGLDKPLVSQYWAFLRDATHLDFGESLARHQPVGTLINSRLGVTSLLVLYSLLISIAMTVPFALIAAVKRDRLADHIIRLTGMVFFGMPIFWLGLVLILIFGLDLGWFPTGGYESGLSASIVSLTLPAVTLGLAMAPLFLRSLRASLIHTLDAGFVEAARARGLSGPRILFRHVLRNASMSTVTLIGVTISSLLSWTVVVENVFAIPGVGQLLVAAVAARDFPMVQGLVFVVALAVIFINLLTDLAYAAIDPRVRL